MSKIVFKPDVPNREIMRAYLWLNHFVGIDGRVKILPNFDTGSLEIVAISQHGYELLPTHYKQVCEEILDLIEVIE